jgi:hypothetical protein
MYFHPPMSDKFPLKNGKYKFFWLSWTKNLDCKVFLSNVRL